MSRLLEAPGRGDLADGTATDFEKSKSVPLGQLVGRDLVSDDRTIDDLAAEFGLPSYGPRPRLGRRARTGKA